LSDRLAVFGAFLRALLSQKVWADQFDEDRVDPVYLNEWTGQPQNPPKPALGGTAHPVETTLQSSCNGFCESSLVPILTESHQAPKGVASHLSPTQEIFNKLLHSMTAVQLK
jgi:hypothetical protein